MLGNSKGPSRGLSGVYRPLVNMQGEHVLTGPIVNESKILIYGAKGQELSPIIQSEETHMTELGRKLTWSVMYEPHEFLADEQTDRWTDATMYIISLLR